MLISGVTGGAWNALLIDGAAPPAPLWDARIPKGQEYPRGANRSQAGAWGSVFRSEAVPNPESELATLPAMTVGEYAEALAAMTDARCCATRSCRVLNRSSRKPKPDTRPATPAFTAWTARVM